MVPQSRGSGPRSRPYDRSPTPIVLWVLMGQGDGSRGDEIPSGTLCPSRLYSLVPPTLTCPRIVLP